LEELARRCLQPCCSRRGVYAGDAIAATVSEEICWLMRNQNDWKIQTELHASRQKHRYGEQLITAATQVSALRFL